MKKTSILIAIALIAGGLAFAKDNTAPKIEIVTKDVDLGSVEKNKIFDYKIEVKNGGREDLVITSVSSSCGCLEVTGAAPGPVTLKPGQSVYITARIDTNKVSGDFEKMIHIFSNDPENKDVAWTVRGHVLDVAAELALLHGDDGKASFAATATARNDKSVLIMVFYTPGCRECDGIMKEFMPEIKEKYGDKVLVVDYNVDNMESYAFLLSLESKYDERSKQGSYNPRPPIVFVNSKLLYGANEIKKSLEDLIKEKNG